MAKHLAKVALPVAIGTTAIGSIAITTTAIGCRGDDETRQPATYLPEDAGVPDATPFPKDDAGHFVTGSENIVQEITIGDESQFCLFPESNVFSVEIPGMITHLGDYKFGANSAFQPHMPADNPATQNVYEGAFRWAIDSRIGTPEDIEFGFTCAEETYPEYADYWDDGYNNYVACSFDPGTGFQIFPGSLQIELYRNSNDGLKLAYVTPKFVFTNPEDLAKYVPDPTLMDVDPTNDNYDAVPSDVDGNALTVTRMPRIFGKDNPDFSLPDFKPWDLSSLFSWPTWFANGEPAHVKLYLTVVGDCTQALPGVEYKNNIEIHVDYGYQE